MADCPLLCSIWCCLSGILQVWQGPWALGIAVCPVVVLTTGKATALGAATAVDPDQSADHLDQPAAVSPNHDAEATAADGHNHLPKQANPSARHEQEEEALEDDDWEPSPAAPKRKAPARGRKKAEPAKRGRGGRRRQPDVGPDSEDSQESEAEEEEEQAAASNPPQRSHGIWGGQRRKQQARSICDM